MQGLHCKANGSHDQEDHFPFVPAFVPAIDAFTEAVKLRDICP